MFGQFIRDTLKENPELKDLRHSNSRGELYNAIRKVGRMNQAEGFPEDWLIFFGFKTKGPLNELPHYIHLKELGGVWLWWHHHARLHVITKDHHTLLNVCDWVMNFNVESIFLDFEQEKLFERK